LLDPAIVRQFADLAEHPRAIPAAERPTERERGGYFDQLWELAEKFLAQAHTAYDLRRVDAGEHQAPAEAAELGSSELASFALVFRRRLRAAMRLTGIESLFPQPWTAAARRMLPSPSPEFTATAMWGPVIAWCALELLAETVDAQEPERTALDLFDRLRLREPFARSFAALGLEREEGWRAAARIKVVLLTGAGVGMDDASPAGADSTQADYDSEHDRRPSHAERSDRFVTGHDFSRAEHANKLSGTLAPEGGPSPGAPGHDSETQEAKPEPAIPQPKTSTVVLAPKLWLDPDVRWLTGVHEDEGHVYLVREQYEELLWWMLMPSLLKIAGQLSPDRAAVAALSRTIADALATAEDAGYRVDKLLRSGKDEPDEESAEQDKRADANEGESIAEEDEQQEFKTPAPDDAPTE
ncbi:MAG TPA: hypothetical protein VL986_07385, partial [Terracidiphilus sp.]|nr:hypothetical protein [Terracidiphilus sp.]